MPPHADVLQWEHLPFPKSLRDFQRLFPNDERCAAYLEGAKWPNSKSPLKIISIPGLPG